MTTTTTKTTCAALVLAFAGRPGAAPSRPAYICAGERADVVGSSASEDLRGTPGRDVIAGFGGACEDDPAARQAGAWAAQPEPSEPRSGRIYFVRNANNGRTDVAAVDGGGERYENLTRSKANELYVDVSPDGRWVAFTRLRRDGGEIYKVPARGGRAVRLTTDRVDDELPIWSPDSQKVAFVRYAGGRDGEIYVMDADGSNRMRITRNDAGDADPRWSPDGTQLIFNGGDVDANTQEIFLVTVGERRVRKLTTEGVNDTFAEWSPDGETIVYSSYRDDQWDLFAVPSAGGEPVQLTDDLVDDFAPEWSPDGGKIVFVRGRLEGNEPADEVYVMDADGTNESSVSPPELQAFSPDWSPDGTKIAFIGQVATQSLPEWEIFKVAVDGSGLTRVTTTAPEEFDPEWGRRPL